MSAELSQQSTFVTVESFPQYVKEHWPTMVKVADSVSRGTYAEDAVQDALESTWKHINNPDAKPIPANDHLAKYLHTAVRNKVFDKFRRDSLRVKTVQLNEDQNDGITTEAINLTYEEPEESVALTGLWDIITSTIQAKENVEIFRMLMDGFTTPEIAEKFRIPEGTVRSRIFYLKASLRKAAKQGAFDGYR